ncbi:hypothetical protein ABFX02_07G039600 [Erythranthe guttata]
MAHGGYDKRGAAAERKKSAGNRRTKTLAVDKKSKPQKSKAVSLKNQIRSTERMLLRKELPKEVKEALTTKLEGLKKQQETQNRVAVERKIFLRTKKIRFFERSKIERKIKRLEKQQLTSTGEAQEADIADQLSKLKEDLEYVKFFPKTEKYVSLFLGGDKTEIVERRNNLRKQIKANMVAAAASGKELEETGNEDDVILNHSDDDFFLNESSSDEAEADDEVTDKSSREQASSASGKMPPAIQRKITARAPMPPPVPSRKPFSSSFKDKSRFAASSDKKSSYNRAEKISPLTNTSISNGQSTFKKRGPVDLTVGNNSNPKRVPLDLTTEKSSNRKWVPPDLTTEKSSNRKWVPPDLTTEKSGNLKRFPVDLTIGNSSNLKRFPVDLPIGNSSNLSSNADVRKPRRKRRPKKKKQQ